MFATAAMHVNAWQSAYGMGDGARWEGQAVGLFVIENSFMLHVNSPCQQM